jgi:hypothetical protein
MTPVTLITRSKWRRSGHERSSISIGGASSSQRCNEEGIESHCTVRRKRLRTTTEIVGFVKDWEIIADNLSRAGWSWGCVSGVDSGGRRIFVADAHRGDWKAFRGVCEVC